jgi:acyl-CoA hydrolase
MKKSPNDSLVIKSELVLPNDTNTLNNLMGGRLMYLMDVVSAISAQRHSGTTVVTASVDNVSFTHPITIGSVVTLTSKVTRSFTSSMEVHIEVFAENIPKGKERIKTNEAFFTFVAVDAENKTVKVPELVPETAEEKAMFESALKRRELRLVLAGRMKPEEAESLRTLFGK